MSDDKKNEGKEPQGSEYEPQQGKGVKKETEEKSKDPDKGAS